MSWGSKFPIVRITLCLVGGIVCAANWSLSNKWLWIVWALLLICYVGLFLRVRRDQLYNWSPYIGWVGLAAICWAGVFCRVQYVQHDDRLASYLSSPMEAYVAVVLEGSSNRDGRTTITVGVQQVYAQGSWYKSTGKVRLHIKSTAIDTIPYGAVYLIVGAPQLVSPPCNPHAFNYQALLKQQQIYYQQYISAVAFHPIGYHPPSQLQLLLDQLRQFCQAALTKHIQDSSVSGIVLALVLGVKEEMDELLQMAYAGAGTMHVLAVSGLHVGILYGLLSFLVYGRKNSQSQGWIRALLICLGLWLYAGVTGLTPSVLRATWMLTLVTLARLAGRKGNTYNVLATSAFVLLLWNPLLLESISFQLSYLAVWGVVHLQPQIYHWFKVKNFILRHLWMWTSVSLAAQIATTPISFYYFHQFPIYFIIANWIVVPAAFLIFSLGITVLLTSGWGMLNLGLSWLLEQITTLMNLFVLGINQLPYSVVRDVYLDKWHVIIWYSVLASILLFCYTKTFRSWVLVILVSCYLAITNIKITFQQRSQQGVILYSVYPHEALAFVQGTQGLCLIDKALQEDTKRCNHQIRPSLLARGIDCLKSYTVEQAIHSSHVPWQMCQGVKLGYWSGKSFVLIDQPGIHFPIWNTKIHTDLVIITHNSVSSLQPLIAQFEWTTLVVGSSNSKQLTKKLQFEAQQLHLPIYVLRNQGALQVNW